VQQQLDDVRAGVQTISDWLAEGLAGRRLQDRAGG
jgi:hypothetical protein